MNENDPRGGGSRGGLGAAHSWVRQNILGLVAIFIALSGSAVAAQVATQPGAKAAKKKAKKGLPGPRGPQGPPGPSTGPAGGALSGSYPNPSIANGAVGTAQQAQVPLGTLQLGAPQALTASVDSRDVVLTTAAGGLRQMGTSGGGDQRLLIQVAGCYEIEGHLFWDAGSSSDSVEFKLEARASVFDSFSDQAEESIVTAPDEGGVSMSSLICLPVDGEVQLYYVKRFDGAGTITLVGGNLQAHWVSP